MSVAKKIITGGFEIVKDSAKQLADTVSPGKLIEQAIGSKPQGNEFADYLKGLGPNLSPQELEKKKKEHSESDQQKLEEERKKLQVAPTIPAHMRLPEKPKELRPYDAKNQEDEGKKAQIVEAQRKNQPLADPKSKQSRGMLGARRRPKSADFEAGKNIKIG